MQAIRCLQGQVAVVTGGQSGIGKEITAQFLFHGIEKVIIVARSKDKFNAAYDEWRVRRAIDATENDSRIKFVQCDLGNLEAVRTAAQQIKQQTELINILVCNAGLGIQPIQPLNSNGIDPIFATNCIGHQVLTTLLLPLIKNATVSAPCGCRIVVASSSLHQLCRNVDLTGLTRPTNKWPSIHDTVWRYARSKLANILFAKELNHRLLKEADMAQHSIAMNIYVNSYFPGNVVTPQWKGWDGHFGSVFGAVIRWLGRTFGQSAEEAAATVVYLAASPQVKERESRGQYYVPIATADEPTLLAQDRILGEKLWDWIDDRATQELGVGWKTLE